MLEPTWYDEEWIIIMRLSRCPFPTTITIQHWVTHIISQGLCFLFLKKVFLSIGCTGNHYGPMPRDSDLIAWVLTALGEYLRKLKSEEVNLPKSTSTRGWFSELVKQRKKGKARVKPLCSGMDLCPFWVLNTNQFASLETPLLIRAHSISLL